jgi:DNA-binding NarL/FixJ family response regulator
VYVSVVDDNTFYRDWLGQVGTLAPNHHVVARASDAPKLAVKLGNLPDGRCDVVLLDLRTKGGQGADPVHPKMPGSAPVQGAAAVVHLLAVAEAAVAAGHLSSPPGILVHTEVVAPRVHVACLLSGAAGVVLKSSPLDALTAAIDVVATGGLVVSENMASLIDLLAHERRLDLTESEESVLALAGDNRSRHQIARQLGCSESTVDKHLRSIRDKFGSHAPMTDLADGFGLRDLALPGGLNGRLKRQRLHALARRLRAR